MSYSTSVHSSRCRKEEEEEGAEGDVGGGEEHVILSQNPQVRIQTAPVQLVVALNILTMNVTHVEKQEETGLNVTLARSGIICIV